MPPGLLLVFVQGLLQLYRSPKLLFPGQYQAIKLNLISKEYPKIAQALTSLQRSINYPHDGVKKPGPDLTLSLRPGRYPPPLALIARGYPDSSWQAAIHAAKKKQVYAARKLNHLGLILQSMRQAQEAKLADIGSGSSARKPEIEKTLQQIRESRTLWQTYNDKLNDLIIKIE